MRPGETPILFYCGDCKTEHHATVLGGVVHETPVTSLVKQKLCVECRQPTTGSIGQAGYYWPNLCQKCKDEADGVLNVSIKNVQYLLGKVFA